MNPLIRSMHTEAINHEPAITSMQTGNHGLADIACLAQIWCQAPFSPFSSR